jgi:hypothetical protein
VTWRPKVTSLLLPLAVACLLTSVLRPLGPSEAPARPPARPVVSPLRDTVTRALRDGLSGTRFRRYTAQLEAAGFTHNVSPFFLVGIAEQESQLGTTGCGPAGNPFGWNACAGWPWSGTTAGIWYVARALRFNYIEQGRTNIWTIGYRYCCPAWGQAVAGKMRARFGVEPRVTYPTG